MSVELLWHDDAVAVCVKPAGWLSQAGSGPSVPAALQAALGGEIYPVHRLDKPVGGVMVYARTAEAAAFLSAAVQDGRLEKTYLAVLRGAPPASAGRLEDLLYRDARRNKTYVVTRQRKGVRRAALEYETVAAAPGATLVRVRLLTGRTHQIRAQFAARGTPLQGDGPYGGGKGPLALWSASLTFPHPDGRMLHFDCPPPETEPWSLFQGKTALDCQKGP